MSIVGRLETSVAFLKVNAWCQEDDKRPDAAAPDGFRYCAQGAIAYGGFADTGITFCPHRVMFHKGECTAGIYDECTLFPDDAIDLEFRQTMELCNDLARELTGKAYVCLTWYNDADGRTKEDMVEFLEKAIERAKVKQS